MNRHVVRCALIASLVPFTACSNEEPAPSGTGGSGGGGAVSGASAGGSAGASGSAGTGTGGASAGTSAGGSATGGSATGGSATGGDSMGGASGSAGAAGSGASGEGGSAGDGGSGVGGAAGSGGETGGASGSANGGAGGGANAMMNFFVTSDTSETGNLGGLEAADMRCQTLAAAVGHGNKTWRAYLSVANPMTHAIDRIGEGPYYNSTGELVAMTKAALHERNGDAELFLDERGERINGQWEGSPTPNEHDILTGSQRDGMLAMNATCGDWMSTSGNAQVGHSDGLGPNMSTSGMFAYWTGSHTAPCGDLASTGGAGKLYCFVGP